MGALQGEALQSEVQEVCADGPQRKPNHGRAAAQQAIAAGWQDVQTGAGADAANKFLLALWVGPERVDAYWGLGVASHVAKFPLEIVRACFDRAVAGLKDVAPLYSDYGRVLEERDLLPDAIAMFEKALALEDGHLEAHVGLTRAYLKTGDLDKAKQHSKRARQLRQRTQ